jgi:hypothetical protein
LATATNFAIVRFDDRERACCGALTPLLRSWSLAVLTVVVASSWGPMAVAEPLDKEQCAKLQVERKKLLNADMQAALDRGPDWVKNHLTEEAIGRVRHFLHVEEEIQFRCRGGGVVRPKPVSVPLPDRKPKLESATGEDTKPSQTLADSDKTPPGKTKATR